MFNIVILLPCFQIEKSTFYNNKIIVDTRYSCLPSIKRHLLCFCSINSTKKNSNLFIAQSEKSQILYWNTIGCLNILMNKMKQMKKNKIIIISDSQNAYHRHFDTCRLTCCIATQSENCSLKVIAISNH
jgi:hypothetical protein